jgi:hypothetical protein
MKNVIAAIAITLALAAAVAYGEDMKCTRLSPNHKICEFSPSGDVIETFAIDNTYSEIHWTGLEWNEESMKRSPAQTTAACLAGKSIHGESTFGVIVLSCRDDHPQRFSKEQCEKAKSASVNH